jgi:aldose 1-epimerase
MYTPVDATGVPTGVLEQVAGTAFDFRVAHPISERIPERSYDNNLVLAPHTDRIPVAEVDDPVSGRMIQVYTSEPAIQFFVPRPPAGQSTQSNATTAAFCLETQHFPDSPNHPNFPSTTLRAGGTFHSTTMYVFGVLKKGQTREAE